MRSKSFWFAGGIILSTALIGAATGCLGEDDLDSGEAAGDEDTASGGEPSPAPVESDVAEYFGDDGSTVLAARRPPPDAEGGGSLRAGCVRVEYCQHPDPFLGTTCIWDACSFDAAWAECDVDGRFVCGRINPVKGMRRP